MQEIINKLENMILLETKPNMTKEQEYYVAGIADALEVVKKYSSNDLIVGKHYFVIMYKNNKKNNPYIEEMKLYRINKKQRQVYCFTRNLKGHNETPDLVLASKAGLTMRVFESKIEAERNKDFASLR